MRKAIVFLVFSLSSAQMLHANEDRLCLFNTCLSPQKFLADFNDIVSKVKNFYGPLKFKEQKYNFTLDTLANSTRNELANSTTDAERIGNMKKFLARFHDAHISLEGGILHQQLTIKLIPISVLPVDGRYFVLASDLAEEGIENGDEIISFDGVATQEIIALINQYKSVGHDLANFRRNADSIFFRPYYMTDVYPKTDLTTVRFRSNTTGKFYDRVLTWRGETTTDAWPINARLKQNSPFNMGDPAPFFLTPLVRAAFKMKDETQVVKKGGPNDADGPLHAAVYKHNGKVILLVRQSTYSADFTNPTKYLEAYRNLLRDFHDLADVLVIDQTNNPGGNLIYAIDFFRLFSGKTSRNLVFDINADVGTLESFLREERNMQGSEAAKRYRLIAKQLEKMMTDGGDKEESRYFPYYRNEFLEGDSSFQWEKPVLLLINELDVSGGDVVPLLFKENGRARLFGTRTMGGGGNVIPIPSDYTHAGLVFGMTRSLFTIYREDGKYSATDLIENQGVSPDYEYVISHSDVRDHFTSYVKAFSDVAVSLTLPPAAPAMPSPVPARVDPVTGMPASSANHT